MYLLHYLMSVVEHIRDKIISFVAIIFLLIIIADKSAH